MSVSRRWRVLTAVLGVLALLLGVTPAAAPPAAAATMYGHDISWPQCPESVGGFDLPMPPTSTQFVIVGLTNGLAFTENPCLQSQVDWVKANSKPAHAYTMATFPTSAQLSSYGTQGPWSSSTRAGRLSNVGYSEARFAVASLSKVSFKPPVVWIDVEPRPAQPWPTGTAARERENRYVIEGLMRGLRDAGFSYGLYSYLSGWQAITGSWRLPGVPVWATAGHLDYANEALDMCTRASFSGGRVYLSQWVEPEPPTGQELDHDLTCGSYAFTPLPVPPSSLSNSTADFNGDWKNDVLARVTSTAELRLYAGTGNGTLTSGVRIGTGWSAFNWLDTPGDFNGDGALDVLARETSTGYLWLYPGNGRGSWLPRVRVGNGWSAFDAIIGPGDFTGDQTMDVLARERSTGYLWLYPTDGRGGWLPQVRVGNGWHAFDAIVGPGDFNGDGAVDVLVRDPATGYLWLYPTDGGGTWLPRVRVGNGWNGFNALVAAGDLNGDRTADVLARERATGYLWLYPGSGTGGWLPRTGIGAGWNGLNAIF